jgi:hypothetical protein
MSDLYLIPEEQGAITLPDWIGGASLTLAEIGAIACFACLRNESEVPEVSERIGTPEMMEALQSLKDKGVIKISTTGNRVSVQIDLTPVMPACLKDEDEE